MDAILSSFAQQVESMNQSVERAELVSLEMRNNSIVKNFFYLTETERAQDVVEWRKLINAQLTYILATAPAEIKTIRFYTNNNALFSNKQILYIQDYEDEPFFKDVTQELAFKSVSAKYFSDPRSFNGVSNQQNHGISIFSTLIGAPTYRTYVEVELSFAQTLSILNLSPSEPERDSFSLIHEDGGVVFSSNETLLHSLPSDVIIAAREGQRLTNMPLTIYGVEMVLNAAPLNTIDCALVRVTDTHELGQMLNRNRVLFAAISVSGLTAAAFLTNYLVNRLLLRLRMIDEGICKIQNGDFNVRLSVHGDDVIDRVSESLNYMAEEIQTLIRDALENEFQLKDLKLRMLTQHISPHFLNNTLECLKMRALLNDEKDIYQRLSSLSRLMRHYAEYDSGTTTIQRELDGIADYVSLMNSIQRSQCELKTTVPDELLTCEIPSFSLQPLVENAIRHGGRGEAGVLHINIRIERRDCTLRFTVHDDGAGVDETRLAQIRYSLDQSDGTYNGSPKSFGLFYTNERLKLLYGREYGMSFQSVQGEGTTVWFSVPLKQEALHVQSVDL